MVAVVKSNNHEIFFKVILLQNPHGKMNVIIYPLSQESFYLLQNVSPMQISASVKKREVDVENL